MRSLSPRQTLLLGFGVSALGLLCVLGGMALLAWRFTAPEKAVVMLPNMVATPEDTPTPAALGTPLAPPPAPDDPAQIVILPVSEPETQTPAPSATPTVPGRPTHTGRPAYTATATPPPPAVTHTASPYPTHTPPPSPTITATRPSIPTPTATASPAVPQRIRIGRIDLDAPIVPVGQHTITVDGKVFSQWDVPDQRSAGWHRNSAALGETGNLVLNGHHNVNGEVFRYLVALKPGDLITLESTERRYYYVVVQTMTLAEQDQPLEIRQSNARWILPTDDERVTLITCWPYYANTHRLVVIARPLDHVIPPAGIP